MDGYDTDGSSALDPVFNDDSDVDESWRDIGPNLDVLDGGGKGGPASDRSNLDGDKNAGRNAEARGIGRAAENGASGKVGNGQNAKDAESSPFTNSVTGKKDEDEKKKKKRRRGLMRMIGPSGILISVLGVAVALVGGSQWLFPFGLVANGLDQFNVLRTSMNRRTNVFMRKQMDTNRPYTEKKWGIFGNEKFKISKSMSKKFRNNGIIYTNNADGSGLRLLYYEDEDTGQKIAVAANDEDVGRIPDVIEIPDADGNMMSVEINTKMALAEAIDTNENFNLSQNKATRTLRGHIAGWFDSISESFHTRISNTRAKFVETSKTADDEEVVESARKGTLNADVGSNEAENVGEETYLRDEEPTGEKNPDGTDKMEEVRITEPVEQDGSLKVTPGEKPDESTVRDKLTNRAQKVMAAGGTIGCMVMRAIGSINLTIGALHVIQILNYVSGFLEAIDQTKAGEGGSVLAHYMGPEGWSKMGYTTDANGDIIEERGLSNAMLALPTKAFFGGTPVQPSDKSAEKFNVEYVAKNSVANASGSEFMGHLAGIGFSATNALVAFQVCNAYQAISSGIGFIAEAASAISALGSFATGGASLLVKFGIELVKGIVEFSMFEIAIGIFGYFLQFIVPHVAEWLAMDLIGNMAGEDAAYALSSGFNIYAGRQMQQSSGMPGNREEVARQFRETQIVIAEEAEYDRMTHSPFDITNQNTFLGSLAYSMIPVATTMKFSSLFSTVSQVANTVGSSVVSLFPTVRAAGDETWFKLSANEECPSLADNGLIGDAYCNPYFVSNYDTINEDPAKVFEILCEEDNFEEGCNADFPDVVDDENRQYAYNPVVKEKSEYAKWIVSCALRESQFGYVDERIGSYAVETGNTTLDAIVNGGIGRINMVGNALDVAQVIESEKNLGWSTGSRCSSDESKWYSRYSEDQRLLESAGLIQESAVTAFVEKYYAENPLDNSIEGVLARYSGQTKEEINETLAILEYVDFIANYDPAERGPVVPIVEEDEQIHIEADNLTTAYEFDVTKEYILYNDVRNRYYIV